MTEAQIPWLIFIGIIIGSGIGVLLTVIAAIQCGLLPGVKFPWHRYLSKEDIEAIKAAIGIILFCAFVVALFTYSF